MVKLRTNAKKFRAGLLALKEWMKQARSQRLPALLDTLRHKLLGETQFKLDEAERLSTMLGLTMAERDACFFDAENRFSRSATLELPKRGKRQ